MVSFSLTLIRHGETAYNKDGIIQGQMDIPLSTAGLQQAKLVAERLEQTLFTHVYSSDLSRANQTTQKIIEANKVCTCVVKKDKRLRERKFGEFEGKDMKDSIAKAKMEVGSNRNWTDYTPPGAESYCQVKKRVRSFFRDLCNELLIYGEEVEEGDYLPASITRRHGGSLGRGTVTAHRGGVHSKRSHSLCTVSREEGIGGEEYTDAMQVHCERKQESADKHLHAADNNQSNGLQNQEGLGCEINGNDDEKLSTVKNIESKSPDDINSSCMRSRKTEIGNFILPPMADSDILNKDSVVFHLNSSSTSSSVLQESNGVSKSDEEWVTFQDDTCPTDVNSTVGSFIADENFTIGSVGIPADISNTNLNDHDAKTFTMKKSRSLFDSCPNVSLTPTLQHPISSLSSISSGRNSTTCIDDLDVNPLTIADVLVVSHGGFIRELLKFFSEELECKLPGGKPLLYRICQNCSISRFIVSLSSPLEMPSVTCVCINERDHLIGMNEALGEY